ncbi:MAG: CRISPR system precrRNA processing endoribonuclease RAMP protein Cas6 [Candidatus Aminicenantes bacterium]|nr:CRISPR system precrRNA processing endoribonuclease RAMP protein Cas6 [Candidatus Aminicenantes bacterium]
MRKKKKMELLGFTGKLVFQGPLSPFMPWLKTGEKFHIGKNTSFGFGKYKVNIEKK